MVICYPDIYSVGNAFLPYERKLITMFFKKSCDLERPTLTSKGLFTIFTALA